MEYVYAALLVHNAGNEVTEDAITAVLSAANVDVDETRVKALVAALEGIDIDEEAEEEAAEESGMEGLGALFG